MNASHFPKINRWGRSLRFLATKVAIVLLSLWSALGRAALPPPSSGVPVSAEAAQTRNVDVALDALGTVTPVNTVTVTSRVAGVLQEVHYREGQMVHQNDLLAVIDPRPYEAAVTQVQGQLARDQAQLANARLDLERYQAFDLLLLDLHLPKKDGWQLLAELRENNAQLRAIIITAQPDARSRAPQPGVHGLFEKPLDFPELLQAVTRLLAAPMNSAPTPGAR